MLTPEQIKAMAAQEGDEVIDPGTSSFVSDLDAAWAEEDTQANRSTAEKIGSMVAKTTIPLPGTEKLATNLAEGALNLKDKFGKRVQNVKEAFKKQEQFPGMGGEDERTALETGLKTAGEIGYMVGDVFGEGTVALMKSAPDWLKNSVTALASKAGDTEEGQLVKAGVAKAMQAWQDLSESHPRAAENLDSIGGLITLATSVTGAPATKAGAQKVVPKIIEGVAETAEGAALKTKGLLSKARGISKSVPEEKAIVDIISPKLNSKEMQAAIREGRVTRGEESLLWGKKPDIIRQSEEVQQAATTIKNNIPGAHKMNDAELGNALDNSITQKATQLKGEMQTVQVKPETTGKAWETWKQKKLAQEAEPEFDAFAGSKKSQDKFESFLKELEWDITDTSGKFKKPTPKTLQDIWDTRIKYDASIPENVKQATDLSHPSLQFQKQMWLDNRSILNDAINDQISGLGDVSKKAFSEMSDMYMARQNIISKGKVDVKGGKGLLNDPKNWAKAGLGVGGTILLGRLTGQ